jgi:protein involved in polysaccharide export with SLBB domain
MIPSISAILKWFSSGKSMQAGEGRSAWWLARGAWLGLLLWLPAGCSLCRPPIDLAIPADRNLAARRENLTEAYTLHCPDVLDLTIDAHPEFTGQREIGPDGRIDLGAKGRLRVEACTVGEAAQLLAQVTEVPPAAVHLRVAQYKSQQLYLLGQIAGFQRVVPYQGPETVIDLLHRVGGITAGAAQDDIRVIRSHVSEGKPPEVLRVDLQAILLRHDARTNIYLQPQDQIYVGETREFSLSKCIPPWLRPIYETLCGLRRAPASQGDGVTKL